MQGNPHDHHEVEHLDADAVCEACGNVNPEGTLLCKTCGNNLRDQRVRRMKTGGPVSTVESSVSVSNIVRGVVILFGICAVLWAAFNVSTIESWLLSGVQSAEAKSETTATPESFWTGPDAARYTALATTLAEHEVTVAEASIVPPGAPMPSLDGLYILKRSAAAVASPVGSAIVQLKGDEAYFVAILAGGTQIRGSASKSSDTMFQAVSIGILDSDGTYTEAYGYAQLQPTGELLCSGLFGEFETQADIIAIPSPSADVSAGEPAPQEDAAADAAPADAAPADTAGTEEAPSAQ
jgi:hypothetical protein